MIPLALVAMMLGSFLGGFAFAVWGNQTAMDSASAFFGCFALVFTAGFIAPSKRAKTTLVFVGLITLLALLSLIVSLTTNFEGLGDQPPLRKIIIPVSQILGGLYAAFILPPLITPGTLLEQLWKEISALGAVVVFFGIIICLGGFMARFFAGTWAGVVTGTGVIALGIATWFFPMVHLLFRMRKLPVAMGQIINQETSMPDNREGVDELPNN